MLSHTGQFLFFFCWMLLGGCADTDPYDGFPYDLTNPSESFLLPPELREVSGLSWQDDALYLIGDEEGTVYQFDPVAGKIMTHIEMKGDGDFEGVECIDQTIFLLRSDSRLYFAHLPLHDDPETTKVELDIKDNRNLEGLGYDADRSMLLICSKKNNLKKDQFRVLYGVPLESPSEKPEELFEFDHAKLKAFHLDQATSNAQRLALRAAYWDYSFHPSGVAVHPVTRDIYVLSHPQQQLCVLDSSYRLKQLLPLPIRFFRQPEGICFDSSGNLFISNEGRGGKATVLQFHPR